MSIAEANLDLPSNFTGLVKLFPLPNLVLFPGVIQPLHIFEPRYRKLMEDAVSSDQLIAIARLKPDAALNHNEPAISTTVCVGKIVTHAELPDGRFNLLLLGAQRATVIREIATDLPYRMADVKIAKTPQDPMDVDDDSIRAQASRLFRRLVATDESLDSEAVGQLLNDHLPLGMLMDLLTFSSNAELRDQQDILETFDIDIRARKVIEILQSRLVSLEQPELRFPPSFSYN
ncbi:MAG: LON peptidase substrate-binding domain-containing protein [Planctomycetaceae bacterium]|nr:LON peptidase substrate-binding domain-containing protein [Planctomycetaceae bacterium]MCP4464252.1 LON peptidase substrate-binding domain-containing protein [Planctomycetaceae bacterium]MDG1806994.1 LON peptidase substrate-binding domain-containing protein [Pirellulaceae bacterium]MDG2104760.1 LON peptidase substrate-binding domain-containing protein [Pirellulaceae bacterium]